jgi:hypothetical protein
MGVIRYWRYTKEKMHDLIKQGRVIQTAPGTVPAYKRYLDEMPGVSLQDMWMDVRPIGAQAAERLGYPTQKPELLLERIIKTSSNEGDTVLDPFCGCGTAIAVAQGLKRSWIGIDITHLAIGLIKSRLRDAFGDEETKSRRPTRSSEDPPLSPTPRNWQTKTRISSNGGRSDSLALGAQIRRKAQTKALTDGSCFRRTCIEWHHKANHSIREVRAHRRERCPRLERCNRSRARRDRCIDHTGSSHAAHENRSRIHQILQVPLGTHPRLQILTIAELFDGKGIDYPRPVNVTFKRAPKTQPPAAEQLELGQQPPRKPPVRATRRSTKSSKIA